jgi:hypothetical protein
MHKTALRTVTVILIIFISTFWSMCISANIMPAPSCGTVALMVLGQFSDICGPYRATDFTGLSKTFETARWKSCAAFFANFCHEIGCENDQIYIFRFVKYLSTFFYTYLPVNIHFQLIIITNVSILTNPAYFVSPSYHGIVVFSLWGHVTFERSL